MSKYYFDLLVVCVINHVPCAARFAVVDCYYPPTAANHPLVLALQAVKAAGTYKLYKVLRMTIATWIVALRNQFIPCTSKEHFVAFFHFLYTATRRIVEFSCVRVDYIICAF